MVKVECFRSNYRQWFEDCPSKLEERQMEWPQLLRWLIAKEFDHIQSKGNPYTGRNVFLDRDSKAAQYADRQDQHREDLSVYSLYRSVHKTNEGLLLLGTEPVLVTTCQVPNQGNRTHCCADLLGVKTNGDLVLFECKVGTNQSDTPLYALMEGLDYLAHLLIKKNFERLAEGYRHWRDKRRGQNSLSQIPAAFSDVNINLDGHHSVIVLAPQAYYDFHSTDAKGAIQGWKYLSDRYWPNCPKAIGMDFAITDFSDCHSNYLNLVE